MDLRNRFAIFGTAERGGVGAVWNDKRRDINIFQFKIPECVLSEPKVPHEMEKSNSSQDWAYGWQRSAWVAR